MRTKQLWLLAGVAALSVGPAIGAAAPASAAGPRGVGCVLSGAATFKPGLTTTARNYAYKFGGTLGSCQSSDSTLKTGTVKAAGSGNGTCANGTGTGVAGIKWNNGKVTAISFTTTSAGAAVDVVETVVPKVTISGVTYKTTESATAPGDKGESVLAFNADATQCSTTAGITKATFSGPAVTGAAQ